MIAFSHTVPAFAYDTRMHGQLQQPVTCAPWPYMDIAWELTEAAEFHTMCAGMHTGCTLPRDFDQKLLECSETQVVWQSVAAFLTWEVPHALQWWEVRDVASVAHHAADSALVRCNGSGRSSGSMHGRSMSSGAGAVGGSGGYEEQHAWLVVAWALLAIEGACNVATGIPFEHRCDLAASPHVCTRGKIERIATLFVQPQRNALVLCTSAPL